MNTLTEIKAAAVQLPPAQQEKLSAFLAGRLRKKLGAAKKGRRILNWADYTPLEGLPPDLSVDTNEKVRALVVERHAADR